MPVNGICKYKSGVGGGGYLDSLDMIIYICFPLDLHM